MMKLKDIESKFDCFQGLWHAAIEPFTLLYRVDQPVCHYGDQMALGEKKKKILEQYYSTNFLLSLFNL